MNDIVLSRDIGPLIHVIRGQRVMLDSDLAKVYGVSTKRLNEQVKRNKNRFPADFMIRLTKEEIQILKSHIATSSSGWGGKRKPPHAFTEHGAVMLASVLESPRAVEMSLYVVRAFIKLREALTADRELAKTLAAIERRLIARGDSIGENVAKIAAVLAAIKRLMEPASEPPEIPLS